MYKHKYIEVNGYRGRVDALMYISMGMEDMCFLLSFFLRVILLFKSNFFSYFFLFTMI